MPEKNIYFEFSKDLINKFNKLELKRKIFYLVVSILIFISLGILLFMALNPNFTVLYRELTEEELARISKVLEDEKINFRIVDNNIMVPEKMLAKAKIKIATAGIVLGSGSGFEIFDKVNFGLSEEERKINYQRALQSELERTINKIPGIERSRVHLLIEEKKIFEDEEMNSKASVYLKIKPNYNLSEQQILGIQNLVANSVSNLEPENVTIISTDGKILSNFINKEDAFFESNIKKIKNTEEYFRKKIQTFLDSIVGPNNSTVRVSVNFQLQKTEISKESYKPNLNQPAIKNENISSETPVNIGEIQTNSNIIANQQNQIVKQNKNINYEIDKEYQRILIQPGEIKNIYVAVVLNGEFSQEYINSLKESVSVGMGLNFKRGDMIDIKTLPFKKQENSIKEDKFNISFIYEAIKDYLPILLFFILGIYLISTIKGIFKNYQKIVASKTNGKEEINEEIILKVAKENPSEAAKIIKNWL